MSTGTRILGVKGKTGQPAGEAPLVPSPMNIVWAVGNFARQFAAPVILDGQVDQQFIMGDAQTSKISWYVLNDSIQNCLPSFLYTYLVTFRASNAVQATATVQDSETTAQDLFVLSAAYRGNASKGRWDNNIGYLTTQVDISTGTIATVSGTNPTSLVLSSVVGIVVGDIIDMTRISTHYGFKVTAINEDTNTVTGASDAGTPAMQVGDAFATRGFTVATYLKDFRGLITPANIPEDDAILSMEVENVDRYLPTVLGTHPAFTGTNSGSTITPYLKRFPLTITTPVFLASGADGTAPSSTSDWTALQSQIVDGRDSFAILLTETTSATVIASYEAFAKTLLDYPKVIATLQNYGAAWQSLRTAALQFVRRQNWVQLMLFYGYRYVTDPIAVNGVKQIPVHGGVLGEWIRVIYSGFVHRAPAETQFELSTYVDGPAPCPEDPPSPENPQGWDDIIRTTLYDAGVNIVQKRPSFGTNIRNFRSPSDDPQVRDGHLHAINQCIKFTSQDNFQTAENIPNKMKYLRKIANRIANEIVKPLYEGNFPPYCVDAEGGAFSDTQADGSPVTDWTEIAEVQADAFNNPQSTFQQGDANITVTWGPYSLMRSLYITVRTAIKIFTKAA